MARNQRSESDSSIASIASNASNVSNVSSVTCLPAEEPDEYFLQLLNPNSTLDQRLEAFDYFASLESSATIQVENLSLHPDVTNLTPIHHVFFHIFQNDSSIPTEIAYSILDKFLHECPQGYGRLCPPRPTYTVGRITTAISQNKTAEVKYAKIILNYLLDPGHSQHRIKNYSKRRGNLLQGRFSLANYATTSPAARKRFIRFLAALQQHAPALYANPIAFICFHQRINLVVNAYQAEMLEANPNFDRKSDPLLNQHTSKRFHLFKTFLHGFVAFYFSTSIIPNLTYAFILTAFHGKAFFDAFWLLSTNLSLTTLHSPWLATVGWPLRIMGILLGIATAYKAAKHLFSTAPYRHGNPKVALRNIQREESRALWAAYHAKRLPSEELAPEAHTAPVHPVYDGKMPTLEAGLAAAAAAAQYI